MRRALVAGWSIFPAGHVAHLHTQRKTPAKCAPVWDENWDGLQNKSSKTNKKRTLIFVRHGQYEAAEDDQGRVLTALGREQAEVTGKRLATLLAKDSLLPPLDSIIYSTMTRATETHDIIRKNLSSLESPALFEKRIVSHACDLIREGAVCRPIPDTWRSPTDKDYAEDNARVEKAFQKYFQRSTEESTESDKAYSTLYVCHGNVIRYFVMKCLQLTPEAWLRTSVANASITIISIHPSGRVSLQCMGDTGHMTSTQITFN